MSNDVIKEGTLVSIYVTTKVVFFSFGEFFSCCDKKKFTGIHTKVLFEENGKKHLILKNCFLKSLDLDSRVK